MTTNRSLALPFILALFMSRICLAFSDPSEIRIGASFALSGKLAALGTAWHGGLLLAVEDVNKVGGIGGRKLVLKVEDNQGDPKSAIAGINKLLAADRVDILFTGFTHITEAVKATARGAGKVMIYYASSRHPAKHSPLFFRDYGDAEMSGEYNARLIVKLGYRRIALFGEDGEFCRIVENQFRSHLPAGIEIVTHQLFQPGDADFRSQLVRIRQLAPQAIVVCAWRDGDVVMRQLADMGMIDIPTHHYAAPLLPSSDTPEIRSLYERNRSTSTWYGFAKDDQNAGLQSLVDRFKDHFTVSPILPDVAYAYDDIWVLKAALEPCLKVGKGIDQTCLASNLVRTNYDGLSGKLNFSADRISLRPVIGMRVASGKWVLIEDPSLPVSEARKP